jgi:CTP:molybdopterin cytidylyltransferase MocA
MTLDSATSEPTLAGIILAAGESSRMRTDKALLTYRGRTFLEAILSTLHGAGIDRVVVVLGHHAEEIRRAVDLSSAQAVVNTDYRRGQTSSLQAGLRALETENLEAVVLCLVDHPAVSAETLRKLVESFKTSGSNVAVPTFQGQRGHPVLIGRALFAELKKLGPEQGANAVIRKHRGATQFVDVNDAGILTDVDDPETYRGLK